MTHGRWFLKEINPNPGSYLSGKIPYRQFYSLIQQQFGQRLLAVPWVQQRGIQIQPGCIYYFTGTRVLYGSGWSGRLKRQHDTGRVVDATTTEEASVEGCARRVLHAATVNGEATSFPRPIRIQGGCGWTQGRPMTRAQPWEFAAVGLQLEMFCTVLIFRPDDEMPGKHEKIVAAHGFPAEWWKISSIRAETISPRFNFSRMRERWKMFTITVRFYLIKLIFSNIIIENEEYYNYNR